MAPYGKEYHLLPRAIDEDREISPLSCNNGPNSAQLKMITLVAILSSMINLLWAFQTFKETRGNHSSHGRSLYANLDRDVPTPFRDDTMFASYNRTIADIAWDSWVVDPGIVALSHEWVKQKMLPQAQHWPWDGDKGVYLLNGFHNLHCLQLIRQSLISAAEGRSPIEDAESRLEHNLHCIESLRQDTLCNADDTPRYSGYSKKEVSGVMQTRMCRSWDKLEAWARDHTACYRDVGRDVKGFPQIEKYKFCPKGYVFSATGSPMPPWDTGSGVHVRGEE